jgi:signal transduction histidine kinase
LLRTEHEREFDGSELKDESLWPSEISKRYMNEKLNTLSLRYIAELRIYVAHGAHGNHQPAIELGRQIIAIGLETLDLAKIHEHALRQLVIAHDSPKVQATIIKLAGKFFIEALTPIEATHRVALDGHASLDRRGVELAASNRQLKQEIERRKAAEKTLKEKEQRVSELLKQSLYMQGHLRQLSRDLLSAQEEERKTISRELHDDIAQTLMGINVHLATLKKEAAVNTEGLRKKISNTQRIVKKSVEIVHQFARKLRPTMLDDLGLIPALTSFIKDFTKRTGIRVQFTAFPGVEQGESAKRTVLYRVVQAALTNVSQHAKASMAKVSIQHLDDAILLEVHDNGKSFRVQDVLFAKKNKRLGLLGMRERVEMLGGNFSVESEPGKGTSIRARIPFRKGAKN